VVALHGDEGPATLEPGMTSLEGFYAERPEADRLLQGLGRLEFVRTQELLDEALPAPPAVIGDVGGGSGAYAGWLAGKGYVPSPCDDVAMEGSQGAREFRGGAWRPIEPDRAPAAGACSRRAGGAARRSSAIGAWCRRAFAASPSGALPFVALLAVLLSAFLLGGTAAARPMSIERVTVGGVEREVWVHVPAGLAADPPRPLVIAFHGGGSHARAMADRTGLRRAADAHGFVAAFPDGSGRLARARTWNAGECCGFAVEEGVDDVGFALAAIDALVVRHAVDPRRVYLTGMSNGAMMAYRVALERPERVAAIAPVAGAMALDPNLVRVPVPVLHVHGSDDLHAPFEGGVGPASIEGGVRRSVPDTLAAWARAHGAASEPVVTRLPDLADDGLRVERHAYATRDDRDAVVLILVVGGGHTWPGSTARERLLGPSTLDVDVNELMWAYFEPRTAPP
jgi:polyhydroxybutyrate depolymerase